MHISAIKNFNKTLIPPPDKSQTIRALLMGAIASGATHIKNPLMSGDTLAAIDSVKALGSEVICDCDKIIVTPEIIKGKFKLNAINSATVLRLLTGIISGSEGTEAEIFGDSSLSRRDMTETIEPLVKMGAEIESRNGFPPLIVKGKKLASIEYSIRQPSAQTKSAILLAALRSGVKAVITEPIKTRDYTEKLISAMGGNIEVDGNKITLHPSAIYGTEITIGGDISSAAYPLCLALLTSGKFRAQRVSLSPERAGFIKVLKRMGAEIEIKESGKCTFGNLYDLESKGGIYMPFIVESDEVPSLIDEIPLLAVAACFVKGTSVVSGAKALKNKESNRIKATVEAINSMGGCAFENGDEIIIKGKGYLQGGKVNSYGDHRIAMSAVVGMSASVTGGETDTDCISVSYPDFLKDLL